MFKFSRFAVSTMSRARLLVAACRAENFPCSNPSGWVKSSKSHRRSSRSNRFFSMDPDSKEA